MEKYLKYGLYKGELKHVLNVENGISCNCVCPNCEHPLVAKNNLANIKIAHFAHHSGKECDGGIESALHLLAKSILQNTKRLTLPNFHSDYNLKNNNSIERKFEEIVFDEIIIEKQVEIGNERIVPDAIGKKNGQKIFIEFANTHFVDENKKQKIKKMEFACIEIDLRNQIQDKESIEKFLNSNTPFIYWITNPKMEKKYLEKIQSENLVKEEKRKENERKINNYKKDKNVEVYSTYNGLVEDCPKKTNALNKVVKLYNHPILKMIVEGEFWDEEIRGYPPMGKWIFINEKKIVVFPPDNKFAMLSKQEKDKCFLLNKGLNEILKINGDLSLGNCSNCEFSLETLLMNDKIFEVCKQL